MGFEINPNLEHCTLTKWAIEPTQDESIVNELFADQMIHKKKCINPADIDKPYLGRILVSQIDYTVIDGASEVQSLGLIDGYDIPPIDTWFYMISTRETRLLFAWIPNEYIHYANEAIEVNCVDCISWYDGLYPEDLDNYAKSVESLQATNISFTNRRADGKSMNFWSRIKQLFGTDK